MTEPAAMPAVITLHPVSRLEDWVGDVWFPLNHPYLERCWTSVLGPSAILLLRRASWMLSLDGQSSLDLCALASDLGIAGHIRRTIARLVRFGFASSPAPTVLEIYVEVPPLPRHLLVRATETVRTDHRRLLAAHVTR